MKWIWIGLAALALALGRRDSNAVQRIANAIAYAEGFYVSGSRAERNNNPGNLTDDLGYPAVGKDGPFVIFKSIDAGWNALYHQITLMLTNTSGIYNSAMSILDVAERYTPSGAADVAAWASNVAARLGVSVDTPIGEV